MSQDQIKILIIEDEELLRSMMEKGLKMKGFYPLLAGNGNEGIKLFEKERPQIVITDLVMPEKEGIETILELRQIDPEVKIIAMSGGGSTKNMVFLDIAEDIGANATISKPFKPQDLFSVIESLL